MSSLFGKADPSLVAASFKLGQAGVPQDMSKIYEAQAENFDNFIKGIDKVFDSIYADYNTTNDLIADQGKKVLDVLETGNTPNEEALSQHETYVQGFKDRLKQINTDFGKGKKGNLERSKLRAEINRYANSIKDENEMFVNMNENAANSNLLYDLGDEKAKVFAAIQGDYINGTNNAKSEIINGVKTYSIPGVDQKLTMTEINKALTSYDPKHLTTLQGYFNELQETGAKTGKQLTKGDVDSFVNKIKSNITSDAEIRNAGKAKFEGMDHSFEEVLTGRSKDKSQLEKIYFELVDLGGVDLDNDGNIDKTDMTLLEEARKAGKVYTNAENGYSLIDAIRKDKRIYRDLMVDYFKDNAVGAYYGKGLEIYKGKQRLLGANKNPFGSDQIAFTLQDEKGKNVTTYKSAADRLTQRNAVLNFIPFAGILGTYTPDKKRGGYIINGEFKTRFDVMLDEKLNLSGDKPINFGGTAIKQKEIPTYVPPGTERGAGEGPLSNEEIERRRKEEEVRTFPTSLPPSIFRK